MTKFPSEKELKRVREKMSNTIGSCPLSKNASKVDRIKHKLCERFVLYKNNNKITQRALAEKVGINESLMSKIIHYHFDEFTVDRLVNYLDRIIPDFDLEIIDAA